MSDGTGLSRRRYTIIATCYQFLGVAIGMVIGVLLVPLYLRHVPVGTYGAWLATGNVLMCISLVDPGLAYVLQQRAAKAYGEKDLVRLGDIFGTGILMNLGLVGVYLVVSGGIAWNLAHLVVVPEPAVWEELRDAFSLAVIGGALNLIAFTFRCSNQALHAAIPVGAIDLGTRLSAVAVVVLALQHGLGLRAFGLMTLWIGAMNSAGNAVCFFILARRTGIRFVASRRMGHELVGLMSFNFLGRAANVAQSVDLLVINRLLGPEMTAVFGLTRRAPDFLRPILFVPVESAGPSLAHVMGEGRLETIRSVTNRLCWLSVWLTGLATAGCLALNRDFVALWVGPELFAGVSVNALICLQMTAFMLISAFSSLAFYLGDVARINVVSLLRAVVFFALLIAGGRGWGVIGIAVGALLAMTLFVWYPIWSTVRRANLTGGDKRTLAWEGLVAAAAVGFCVLVAQFFSAQGWTQFTLLAGLVAGLYGSALAVMSRRFRSTFVEASQYLRGRIFSAAKLVGGSRG